MTPRKATSHSTTLFVRSTTWQVWQVCCPSSPHGTRSAEADHGKISNTHRKVPIPSRRIRTYSVPQGGFENMERCDNLMRQSCGFVETSNQLRRWRSGQSQQTVNLSGIALRRFESFPAHKCKKCQLSCWYFLYFAHGFENRSEARWGREYFVALEAKTNKVT